MQSFVVWQSLLFFKLSVTCNCKSVSIGGPVSQNKFTFFQDWNSSIKTDMLRTAWSFKTCCLLKIVTVMFCRAESHGNVSPQFHHRQIQVRVKHIMLRIFLHFILLLLSTHLQMYTQSFGTILVSMSFVILIIFSSSFVFNFSVSCSSKVPHLTVT